MTEPERLAECVRRVVDAFAVADEHELRVETPEPPLRREHSQQGVHAQRSAAGGEVADRPEHVGDDKHASVGPPQRTLVPEREVDDLHHVERRIDSLRQAEVRHREAGGDVDAAGFANIAYTDNLNGPPDGTDPHQELITFVKQQGGQTLYGSR